MSMMRVPKRMQTSDGQIVIAHAQQAELHGPVRIFRIDPHIDSDPTFWHAETLTHLIFRGPAR